MSTKSSVFHQALQGGGEVHVFYEMYEGSYFVAFRIPGLFDVVLPLSVDEMNLEKEKQYRSEANEVPR